MWILPRINAQESWSYTSGQEETKTGEWRSGEWQGGEWRGGEWRSGEVAIGEVASGEVATITRSEKKSGVEKNKRKKM
jgi:chitodextrinase